MLYFPFSKPLPLARMTANAPDPRTFEKWEDAFQYPIPTVRGMERKLRSSTVENQDKMRTLVGYA